MRAIDFLKVLFTVLFNPYLLGAILAGTAYVFAHFYGFLGVFVFFSNPVILALVAWTVILLTLNYIKPVIARFFKNLQQAFVRWIKKDVLKLKTSAYEEQGGGDNELGDGEESLRSFLEEAYYASTDALQAFTGPGLDYHQGYGQGYGYAGEEAY